MKCIVLRHCSLLFRSATILCFIVFTFPNSASSALPYSSLQINEDGDSDKVKTTQLTTARKKSQLLNTKSWDFMLAGNYDSAISCCQQALNIANEIHAEKEASSAQINMSVFQIDLGNYVLALHYVFQALEINDRLKNQHGKANCHNNIGIIYYHQQNYEKALEHAMEALKIEEELHLESDAAKSYNNLCNAYEGLGRYALALRSAESFLRIQIKLKDTAGIAAAHNNMGDVYLSSKDYVAAETNFEKARVLFGETKNKTNIATAYINLGRLKLIIHDFSKAKLFLDSSLVLGLQIQNKDILMEAYQLSYQCDSSRDDKVNYLKDLKSYFFYRDSMSNQENQQLQIRTELNYEFSKKEASRKIQEEEGATAAKAKSRLRNILLISAAGLILLFLLFAIFIYRALVQKRKIHRELNAQSEILEAKQKEILDSIIYAQRIQRSLLPSERLIGKLLKKLR